MWFSEENVFSVLQAIHEDEDEGMEEGMQLVSQILGDEKQHLYPSILQLVMADGAFLEGETIIPRHWFLYCKAMEILRKNT